MHIKEKIKNRIVSMLMCILLLSNFGLSVAIAAETGNQGYVQFYSGNNLNSQVKIKANEMIANYTDLKGMAIIPEQTAIYTITLENGGENVKYVLYNEAGEYAALATTYQSQNTPLTANTNPKSTTIDVVLKAGQKYHIEVRDSNSEVNVTVVKRNIMELAMMATDIPSNVVSAKEEYDANKMKAESFEGTSVKTVQYGEEEIKKYALVGKEADSKTAKGDWLEGVLVDLVMLVLSTFIMIVEWAIGTEDGLTIDNIIFNRFDQTVIDLTPLGGIQHTSETTGQGFFYNTDIINVIKVLFDGLKVLAIVIYIVMLLYIGVKILLSVGTKDQKKYLKYIEYWITGIVFLIIIPYFLPILPTITNSLVALMEEQARSLNGDYSVSEVLEALGKDPTYLGEDAEIVTLHALIDEEVDRLAGMQTGGTEQSREEAQAGIQELIDSKVAKYNIDADLRGRIDKVISFIDEHYDVQWTEEILAEYNELVIDVREKVYLRDGNVVSTIENMNIPDSIKSTITWDMKGTGLYINIRRWAADFRNSEYKNKVYDSIDEIVKSVERERGSSVTAEDVRKFEMEVQTTARNVSNMSNNLLKELEEVFSNYRNAVVQERIDELEDMKLNISQDIMTTLKSTAQEENRFIYAVAWAILVFQMLAILFMYYKRIFVILILIVLFPIVMTFYVIDKINDGKAQSLEIWFKEILANLFVQVLHAGIYIILINIGIDACNTDPKKYWFFLILTVCFLFPGERILRGILDLQSSTIGELRNRGALALGIASVVAARKGIKGVKDFRANGGVKGAKEKIKNEVEKKKEKLKEELEAPEKKKAEAKARKERLQQRKNDSRNYRQQLINSGEAGKLTKLHGKIDDAKENVKRKINGFALVKGTKAAVSAIKSSGVGKALKYTNKYGKFALKKAGKLAKKTAGFTMAAVEGMESFGEEGIVSGAGTFMGTARQLGAFDKKAKEKDNWKYVDKEKLEKSTAQAKFGTVYQNGEVVRRNVEGTSVKMNRNNSASSNTSRPIEYYSSRTAGKAIKSKLNINKTTTQNNVNTKNS